MCALVDGDGHSPLTHNYIDDHIKCVEILVFVTCPHSQMIVGVIDLPIGSSMPVLIVVMFMIELRGRLVMGNLHMWV